MTRGLPPEKIVDRGNGLTTAELPDGTIVVLRPGSSRGNSASSVPARDGGYPTVEIQRAGKRPEKVRYVP